ncbi:M14 family metallopeptidase [uncultured Cloacibacillus sp.]|uniref:M14 family metallopeptidase n=1 Tax=uncultured Cloacibacillus sp. TaxID=889794 RepID=UPI00320B3542
MSICGVTAGRGETARGFAVVPGSGVKIPLVLVNGERPGPSLLLTAGIHGAEYPGIAALSELGQELDAREIAGAVIMLYPVNLQGFWKRCDFIVPDDEKNLNRVFPGSPRGTLAERTAYMMISEFFPAADFYADLHSGDLHENLCPHVYYPGQPDETVESKSKKMALTLDMKYMVRSLASGGAYNYAASTGLPSILVERGCMGLCPRFDVEAYKKDLLRLMHGLGMTENEPEPQQFVPKDMRNMKYLEAPRSGCWLEEAECGAVIKKGEPLGRLRGFFGEDETVFSAEYTGVLLYSCSAFAAPEGVVLAAYGVPDAE